MSVYRSFCQTSLKRNRTEIFSQITDIYIYIFNQGAEFFDVWSPVIENIISPLIYKYTDCLLIRQWRGEGSWIQKVCLLNSAATHLQNRISRWLHFAV